MPEVVWKPRKPKILVLDVETTDLQGDFGEVVVFGYRWAYGPPGTKEWNYWSKARSFTIMDWEGWQNIDVCSADINLLEKARGIIEEADVIIGHFVKGFDLKMINTRLIVHGLKPLPHIPVMDTCEVAKTQLALSSYSMANVAKALGCGQQKGGEDKATWRRFKAFYPEAIRKIAKYCRQDVDVNHEIAERLWWGAKSLPNMQTLMATEAMVCPKCGSEELESRGSSNLRVTAAGRAYHRFRCLGCGHWPHDPYAIYGFDGKVVKARLAPGTSGGKSVMRRW